MLSRSVPPDHDDLTEVPCFTLDMHERPGADAVEVLLTGDLDALAVGHLDDSLAWVVDHMAPRQVIVDVSGLDTLENPGVQTLLRVRAELAEHRRTLTVVGDQGAIRTLLELAGLLSPADPATPRTGPVG